MYVYEAIYFLNLYMYFHEQNESWYANISICMRCSRLFIYNIILMMHLDLSIQRTFFPKTFRIYVFRYEKYIDISILTIYSTQTKFRCPYERIITILYIIILLSLYVFTMPFAMERVADTTFCVFSCRVGDCISYFRFIHSRRKWRKEWKQEYQALKNKNNLSLISY